MIFQNLIYIFEVFKKKPHPPAPYQPHPPNPLSYREGECRKQFAWVTKWLYQPVGVSRYLLSLSVGEGECREQFAWGN